MINRFSSENRPVSQTEKNENPLFDSTTNLYTFPYYLSTLQKTLMQQGVLGLVIVDASELSKIEYDYGQEVYSSLLKQVAQSLDELKGLFIRENDILTIHHPSDEVFLIFLAEHRPEYSGFLKIEKLQHLIERFTYTLNAKIFQLTLPYTKKILKVDVGYSYIVQNPLLHPERMIYRLIEQAKNTSKFNGNLFIIHMNEMLKELIMDENVESLFQPIVDLHDGSLFAYEALTRGPQGSPMESPLILFNLADKANLSFELDRLCRRKAIQSAKGILPNQKLFINVFPATMHDPEFRGPPLLKLLENAGLQGQNIVFEITERFAIENYVLFQKEQEYYSTLGFTIAIDDMGTGYATLEAIANLKPQYVKIDLSIIRDIDKFPIKQELLKAMVDISLKVKAKILAEGIESKKELETVRAMGVHYGQGYYFARPEAHFYPADKKFNLD